MDMSARALLVREIANYQRTLTAALAKPPTTPITRLAEQAAQLVSFLFFRFLRKRERESERERGKERFTKVLRRHKIDTMRGLTFGAL